VSLSGDGTTGILGGPFDDKISNNYVGAAWVFAQPVFAGTPGKSNRYSHSVSARPQRCSRRLGVRGGVSIAECHHGVLRGIEGDAITARELIAQDEHKI
jgi:hypothetical protein